MGQGEQLSLDSNNSCTALYAELGVFGSVYTHPGLFLFFKSLTIPVDLHKLWHCAVIRMVPVSGCGYGRRKGK